MSQEETSGNPVPENGRNSQATHKTKIGRVNGPVHTGSGDIYISSDGGSSPSKIGIIIPIVIVLTVVSLLVFSYWYTNRRQPAESTPAPIPLPVMKFRSIEDGQSLLASLPSAHGIYQDIPDGQELWLVAWQGSTCYPMDGPAIRSRDNTWTHGPLEFWVAGEVKLSAVLANEQAAAILRSAQGKRFGLPCLPNGAVFIENITVHISAPSPTPGSN